MQDKNTRPTSLDIFKSVFTALVGLQSSRVHERNVTQGRPALYIFASIVVIVFIILALVGLVQLILRLTGA